MKFGQLIKYNKINIFLQNRAENEAGRLVPGLFFCQISFQALFEVKASGLQLSLDIY